MKAAEAKKTATKWKTFTGKLAPFIQIYHHQFIRADMIHKYIETKKSLSSLKNEKGYSELGTTYQTINLRSKDIQKVNEWFSSSYDDR